MRKVFQIGFVCLLVAALLCAVGGLRGGVETSLYALVGGDSLLVSLAEKTSNIIRVHCTTDEQEAACRSLYNFDPPLDLPRFLETIRTKGKGILTAKSRDLLAKDDLGRIRRSTLRRDYAGMGLFPKADDPYYFLNDFVMALKNLKPTGEGTVLTGTASGGDLQLLIDLAAQDPGISLSGAPFHTLLATEETQREINLLGTVSLIAVFVCGWFLFRSFRFALPTAGALASGFVVGAAAVCFLPGKPHALTFLFGTTLVGLGVDYCYHTLAEKGDTGFVKSLTQALASTLLAFTPLLFSSAGVLQEMALFTMAGLLTIYAFVLLFGKRLKGNLTPAVQRTGYEWRKLLLLSLVAVLAMVACVRGFDFNDDPAQFHEMTPLMARGEAKFAELMGETTENLVLVPLQAWQEENSQLKAKLGDVTGEFLTAEDLPAWLTVGEYVMLPKEVAGEGYRPVNPKAELASLFASLSRETYILLGIACIGFLFFIKKVWTALVAVVCTILTLAAFGQSINFFQAMSFFILIGLGIDYAVFPGGRVVFYSFLTSLIGFGMLGFTSFPVTRGMGLTLAIGLFFAYTLAALFANLRPGDAVKAPDSAHWSHQKEQSAGKGRLLLMWYFYRFLGKSVAKLLFLPGYLFIYPFCKPGRAALCEYYRVIGVKPRPFRHILAFAWSLLDKIDACALCKNPPRFMLTGDTDWMKGGAFLLSTHVGCIEVLPALRKTYPNAPRVHAFQQMGHNALYTELFAKKLDPNQLTLHAVEDIGVETAVEMQEAIRRGELVLMAGDRVSAGSNRNLTHDFFGVPCQWPKGVFRFAKLMECPVYGIVCAKTGWNVYEVSAQRLDPADLLASYLAFLTAAVKNYPYQWYQFYRFF